MDDTDKAKCGLKTWWRRGSSFEPPDVNLGHPFPACHRLATPLRLGAIKGTGQQAIEAIIAAREGVGPGHVGRRRPLQQPVRLRVRVDRVR